MLLRRTCCESGRSAAAVRERICRERKSDGDAVPIRDYKAAHHELTFKTGSA
jgi:hypothetical protein